MTYTEREGTTMSYIKPEVVELVRAAEAIRSHNDDRAHHKSSLLFEGCWGLDTSSGAAYEADE
jgi:hypothetical protein